MSFTYLLTAAFMVIGYVSAMDCTSPLVPIGGRCYLFSQTLQLLDWEKARSFCKRLKGMDLATLGRLSAAEASEGAAEADPLLKHFTDTDSLDTAFFIGATKIAESWNFVDGRSLSDTSKLWKDGKPAGAYTCVGITKDPSTNQAKLENIRCESHTAFVCEMETTRLPYRGLLGRMGR